MSRRYLFGPVTAAFADQNLCEAREAGECLAFDSTGRSGFRIGPEDTWETVRRGFPSGWEPDFIVLYLPYTQIPDCLWSVPVPIIGVAADFNLLWHWYRHCLPRCDLLLADTAAVEVMEREGMRHGRTAVLFGCERCLVDGGLPAARRDIDVLFVGNMNPAVQRERLPWLERLAGLASRWRVSIQTGVRGADYHKLLRRSRIVFNRSIRDEANQRTFEAVAAGALLFQEAGNREVPAFLQDRRECVYYTHENLEQLLEHYLENEDERGTVAETAQRRAARFTFEAFWQGQLADIEREWPVLVERSKERGVRGQGSGVRASRGALLGRVWQALSGPFDGGLAGDLSAAIVEEPGAGWLHNALGLIVALGAGRGGKDSAKMSHEAAGFFERAVGCDRKDSLAHLNWVEALYRTGQGRRAQEEARRALDILNEDRTLPDAALDGGHFPPAFDVFRVEWERASWSNAGNREGEARTKRDLLRWRLACVLGDATGDPKDYYEAVLGRPDLPVSRAALGCALARNGDVAKAVPHLRQALRDNPFDVPVARALFKALGDMGDGDGQRRLADRRRLLSQAAGAIVPAEPWMAPAASEFEEPTPVIVPKDAHVGSEAGHDAGARHGTGRVVTPALAVVWEGAHELLHSLALVNRNICARLLQRGVELSLLPTDAREPRSRHLPLPSEMARRLNARLHKVDAHIRHHWPPNFTAPPAGRWVVVQPWEFGAIPKTWIEPLNRLVDELWVPSRFVRECFVKGGVDPARVRTVPQGVGPEFRPDAEPLRLQTKKRFKFLFVGGTIRRKGIDILLEAYARAFTRSDDVCLVIKDMGVGSFYGGQTAQEQVAAFREDPKAPEIEYIDRALPGCQAHFRSTENEPDTLAGLYTACDCLVHPYRGEGFGLPIVEAMASGLPVIVTGYGPALDYADDATAYLVPATVARFPEQRVGDLETVGHPWLAEPDRDALTTLMRHVVDHPEEARRKGEAAGRHIREHFTWEHTADAVVQRLEALREQPIRRLETRQAKTKRGTATQSRGHATHGASAAPGRRHTVSLCLIVRNEEKNLAACLGSAADLVDEIVVVDTGSTDRTKEVAERFCARVFDFTWVDNFAAARNESLRHATGEWIFWMDADDRLDEENRRKLRALLAGLGTENAGYVMKCRCLPQAGAGGSATVVDHLRLFRNIPGLEWSYRVHEQIVPALRARGAALRATDVVVHHVGYRDPALRGRKQERDLRLLHLDLAEHPHEPFILFNLGWNYLASGKPDVALPYLRESLERCEPSASIVRKLYPLLMDCHLKLGQRDEALAVCREGRKHFPHDEQLLHQEASLRQSEGDLAAAEKLFLELIETREPAHFASVTEGLRGYKARHELASIYMVQGRIPEAEAQWRAALAESPAFGPSCVGLAKLYLQQERPKEAEEVVGRWEAVDSQAVREAGEVWAIRAQSCLVRKDPGRARSVLEEAVRCRSGDAGLWKWLGRANLLVGGDRGRAIEALGRTLELVPNDVEARDELARVLLG